MMSSVTRRASLASLSEPALHLEHARRRTKALLEPLTDEQLTMQFSPLQSPLVWDLAHIGHFEELWLLRGGDATATVTDDLYDAFAHPRAERGTLPMLSPGEARAYVRAVRDAVLERLPDLDPFLVGMVAHHELQHGETVAQTLALAGLLPRRLPEVEAAGDVVVPAGEFAMGSTDAWAYDNERPQHDIDVPEFRIDRALVTNSEYAAFIEAGGYHDRKLWSDDGWAWRHSEQAVAPLYWEADAPPRQPVQHVSAHEAEAYARWVGKRLPAEAEWEKAVKTLDAELEHVSGAVWQWTASAFKGYPGFRAYPYREYSEPFFGGEYRVLRGGSWYTDPLVARTTFRNWDFPRRRQIFSGLRCASDG
jgi:gamma-glutamyl hercynylcysteine S-oxide synthase